MFEPIPLPEHALDTFQCGSSSVHPSSFQRLEIWGNGSCLYHSIASLLVYKNEVHQDTVTYYLAIPSTKRLPETKKVSTTTETQTVSLVFTVPKRFDGDRFYKNFQQVGPALRKYLSTTLTKNRYEQFLKESFSSEYAWAVSQTAPSWEQVKQEMSQPHTHGPIYGPQIFCVGFVS